MRLPWDECEEILILDAFLRIAEAPATTERVWIEEFRQRLLVQGLGLAEPLLLKMNRALQRRALAPITLSSTVRTPYMDIRGHERVLARERIVAALRNTADRPHIVADALEQVSKLEPFTPPQQAAAPSGPPTNGSQEPGHSSAPAFAIPAAEQRRHRPGAGAAVIGRPEVL
jgi:hypothetical protein